MSSPLLEAFLARLYTEPALMTSFLADPATEAGRAGLNDSEVAALCAIDRNGLRMAAESYSHKRNGRQPRKQSPAKRLLQLLSRRL
ncbi:hypothetical protein BH11PSE11_BH11PSE11_10620 [soil metagenome]